MAKICLCLTAKTLERNLEILNKYRKYTDIVELRVDCLAPDERLLIRDFPQMADIPVILAIRRDIDGGFFDSGEGSRINLMARGLAYADADRRRNFAYLDIEEDLNVPSLEEAARSFGTRIIRSYHAKTFDDIDMSAKFRSMQRSGDEIIKFTITANSILDVYKLMQIGKNTKQDKIMIARGHFGVFSRILAEKFGSYLCYTGALAEPDISLAAPGQVEITELVKNYRFRSIRADTKVFGVLGYPLLKTGSPNFFNAVFDLEGTNAVYVPFPSDSIDNFYKIFNELDIAGLSVTVPYKETVVTVLKNKSEDVQNFGACNTVSRNEYGLYGSNTDAKGFTDSLLAFLNRTHLKRMRATIIGAGGTAKAVAHELYRLGAKALILNRTVHKARDIAVKYKFAWNSLDKQGIDMMNKFRDIIIQASSAGMAGIDCSDPAPMYSFCGKENVMDMVYNPNMTPFLTRAQDAGCKIINGYDMLIRQAQYQYLQFFGREFPKHLLSKVTIESE